MFEKQRQEAGDNSQQIQAETVNYYSGIDEKREREIIDEKVPDIIQNYSREAQELASERIEHFTNDLIPKLVRENLLEGIKNPSIQMLLVEAQKTATSTERVADYELLSELILHRINKDDDRNTRTGINRAVQIVDEISDEALLGLTVAHCASNFIPVSGKITEGLTVLSDLFERVIYDKLPTGNLWLEQLDILDALRTSQIGSLKNSRELYSTTFSGYIEVGILKDSEIYQNAIKIINELNIPRDILTEHELRQDYVRLKIFNIDNLDDLLINHFDHNGQFLYQTKYTDEQKQALRDIYYFYEDDSNLKEENIDRFLELWDSYESLKALRNWWDSIPSAFNITSVGRVLAHANAQRCDSTLPALN